MATDSPTYKVLVVCTANICRSPMLEVLLRRDVAEAGLDVVVGSAGLLAGGSMADEYAVEAMGVRGLDIGAHRSRNLGEVAIEDHDLVLGLAREHVRSVAVDHPRVYRRTFTVKEFVRRGTDAGPPVAGESMEEWIARVRAGRRSSEHLGASPFDDVADPYGLGAGAFARTADELEALSGAVTAMLSDGLAAGR